MPPEILLAIFECVTVMQDSHTAYATLCNAALVCHAWQAVATPNLLYHVELAEAKDAESFLRVVQDPQNMWMRTLVVSVALGVTDDRRSYQETPHLVDWIIAAEVLRSVPLVRHLTILVLGGIYDPDSCPLLKTLPTLSGVTSVTFSTALSVDVYNHSAEAHMIAALPASVQKLEAPCPPPNHPVAEPLKSPTFALRHLTVHIWPTDHSEWILSNSRDTIQSITCWTLASPADFAQAVIKYPNLRSLFIIGRHGPFDVGTSYNFRDMESLEKLEINDQYLHPERMNGFPPALEQLRLRSELHTTQDIAERLEHTALRMPHSLEVLVWDYCLDSTSNQEVEKNLAAACRERRMKFLAIQRPEFVFDDSAVSTLLLLHRI